MKPCGVITLLTDFGLADPFVGVMKGVLLGRFPEARIVDLSHAVPAQAIELGALWLELSVEWFPPGTVHVAVVDPGVGSDRAAVVFRADDRFFVAPDNGICDRALARAAHVEARRLDAAEFSARPSSTFHGRDVFAPAAAELASGRRPFDVFGVAHAYRPSLAVCAPRADADCVSGEVVWIDRFGNLVTNIDAKTLSGLGSTEVLLAARRCRVVETYAAAAPRELVALVDSFGLLEIAVRDGNASDSLGLERGAAVRVVRLPAR